MPQSGKDDDKNPIWAGNENEIEDSTGTEAIISRPEDRGKRIMRAVSMFLYNYQFFDI